MSETEEPRVVDFFSEQDPASCRIETQQGTVYWLSFAGEEGQRWIVREHLQSSDTNTMVVHKFSQSKEPLDLGGKFRGKLAGDIRKGMPFVIEVTEHETRILSEVVIDIEVGNIPEMIFPEAKS